MFNRIVKIILPLILLSYVAVLYRPFFLEGRLPISADAIVGMYHPWRDSLKAQFPSGVPVKNSLITDSVRQEFPWRKLAIDQLKVGELPLWNSYSFSGYPLMANFQSAAFYPLNLLYWLGEFPTIWSWQIILQTILGLVFMILFLRNLKLSWEATTLGSLTWVGSGFFVSWLETNVVIQSAIWLPLILLAIDKKSFFWKFVLIFSLCASLLAGHLQTFFYTFLLSGGYLFYRVFQTKDIKHFFGTGLSLLVPFGLLAWWLISGFQFIFNSARGLDQANWLKPDWFIPWKHAVQILAPDFFGNPVTQNYFGVWNYGEFVSYIGIVPFILALGACLLFKKEARFFILVLVGSILFAFPTFLAKLPFELNLPLISSAQPSRLIFLMDFSLAVLAALGFDHFLKSDQTKIYKFISSGIFVLILCLYFLVRQLGMSITVNNLYLPLVLSGVTFISIWFRPKALVVLLFLGLTLFDLSRFGVKFETFSDPKWLYPQTITTEFLQEKAAGDFFRIASVDERVLAQNFSTMYRLQSISGYDPLYLERYGEFISAMERNSPNISLPFGFNRIITPKNYHSRLFDLLGVKYVVSLSEVSSRKYNFILAEGDTKVYENTLAFPRAFFVEKTIKADNKNSAMNLLFDGSVDLRKTGIVEGTILGNTYATGSAEITYYSPNELFIKTHTSSPGFLILTEIYYPTWIAEVDSKKTEIFVTDYMFRGIEVPAGVHEIRFQNKLL